MKILLLSSSTGEGHNSAALAIKEAFSDVNIESEHIDPISFKNEKMRHRVASIYNNMISKTPIVFGIIYRLGAIYDALGLPSPVAWANSKYSKKLAEYVVDGGFDAVVCTHLFSMQAMVAVREREGVKIPCYAVMTDYTPIPFHKDTKSLDGQFAPTESVKNALVKKGFDSEKIYVTGIPVKPKFSLNVTKEEAKAALSLPLEKRVIMILSGGAGCGNMVKLCRAMDKALGEDFLICVFPGKNEKLRKKLKANFDTNKKIAVIDFTPAVDLYMKASDVVLSKPGGLTSTEIAVANCPFVHLKAVPGCESYNIKYFTSLGMSVPAKNTRAAVRETVRLINDISAAQTMTQRQREYIPQDSAKRIINKILEEIK